MSLAERNLLFGIVALQMDFISQDALIRALNAWVLDKTKTLGQLLEEQGAFGTADHGLLEALVQRHVERHGEAVPHSLAAVAATPSVRREMSAIADDDLQASLGSVWHSSDTDVDTTGPYPVEPEEGARYRMLRPHAKGGLGEVFVAEDRRLHREVALKEIQKEHANDTGSRSRFVLEAEVNGRLEHPGIVPVYDLGRYADGRPFYAMRFIEGETLKDAIWRFHDADVPGRDPGERSLSLRQLLGRFVTICNAVAYAHSRGILHRDIKPANIMLGKFGETLLVDWGLAKVVGRPEADHGSGEVTLRPVSESDLATQMGTALGTPAFMSPEQAAGRLDELGPASDVYSLGATLYTLLTRHPPFEDQDRGEILRKVRVGEWLPPCAVKKETPKALDAICRKALALETRDRYASAQALAADVEHWLADEPIRAWREPWTQRTGRWMRRHRTPVSAAAAALLAVVLLGGGGWLWLEKDRADREGEANRELTQAEQLRTEARTASPERSHSLLAVALAAAQRADGLLGNGRANDELRQRVKALVGELQEEERDRRMLVRLDEVRFNQTLGKGLHFDWTLPDAESARAFREYGIDVEALSFEEAADQLRARPIRAELGAALDYWATWKTKSKSEDGKRLFDLARAVDPDPNRNQVREALAQGKVQALKKLAVPDKLASLPLPTLVLLGYALNANGAYAEAEIVLQQAQQRNPGDTVVNWALGISLSQGKRSRWEEALRFNTVAVALSSQHRGLHVNLAETFSRLGRLDEAIASFRKAIDLKPGDAYCYYLLSDALRKGGRPDDASACERKARELGADDAEGYVELGTFLIEGARLDDAIARFRKAIELKPNLHTAHFYLGLTLHKQHRLDDAVAAFRKTIELKTDFYVGHVYLGVVLYELDRMNDAVASFRRAIELKADYYPAQQYLGYALADQERLEDAVAAYRRLVELKADDYLAHWNLGFVLVQIGQFREALIELRRGHELGAKAKPPWSFPSGEWLRIAECMGHLDGKLPALLRGAIKPADDTERLAVARLCQMPCKRLYAASARFWGEAFDARPELAENLKMSYRYMAAGAAARAGSGHGEDAPQLGDKEKARLRGQALDWLKATLNQRRKELESDKPEDRAEVQRQLSSWQRDRALIGLRDPQALAKLPEVERKAWQQLWGDVAGLVEKAGGKK